MNQDEHYMRRALELASRGAWTTHPNPNVGCVICQNETIVGEGWHEKPGSAHAEIMALEDAGMQARASTVYVTLEPCAHTGLTGPCCNALVDAGVSRVVVAVADPNPLVNGRGMEYLRAAGIEVSVGLLEAEGRRLNPGFMSRFERGRPWVRLKLAASLDGRTATHSGDSKWITSPEARTDVQSLRASAGAILTGIGTVLADNPRLNVRVAGASRQPLRVIVDSSLRTPSDAEILRPPGNVLIACVDSNSAGAGALQSQTNVELVALPGADGRVDPDRLLRELAGRNINDVHVEAGSELCGSLLQSGLVDETILYMAAKVVGTDGRGMFDMKRIDTMADARQLNIRTVRRIGPDIRIDLGLAEVDH